MKIIIVIALLLINLTSHAQQGRSSFLTQFDPNATGLNKTNAYLIAYLNAMVYPGEGFRFLYGTPYPKPDSKNISALEKSDPAFKIEYERRLKYLFEKSLLQVPGKPKVDNTAGIVFDFQTHCNPAGYDPEAMIISTNNFIQVIFRGTDRVSCASSDLGYEFLEWTKTNLDFGTMQPPKFSGKVHQGFWKSLNDGDFAYKLAKKLIDVYDAKNKKVWISGHSLGGAHAQLFSLYLKLEHQVNVQGLYLYASPHPGDEAFVNQINSALGKNNIQRFEFVDDPIPVLPPQLPPFNSRRAGIRNWFKDINTVVYNSEQKMGIDDWRAACALTTAPANVILHMDVFSCPGSVCYHHPTWYLKACRNLLPASQYNNLPPDIPTPDQIDAGCTPLTLCLGKNNDAVACAIGTASDTLTRLITIVGDAIENIVWNAENYWSNISGDILPNGDGKYRVACYKFSTKEKKYLTRKSCSLDLTNSQISCDNNQIFLDKRRNDGKQIFLIKKDGANYIITNPDNNNSVVAIDAKEIAKEGADVDMSDRARVPVVETNGDIIGNQHWWFFKIISGTGKVVYLIKNSSLPSKVIDAADACNSTSEADCGVNVYKGVSNDLSQLWILEKVN